MTTPLSVRYKSCDRDAARMDAYLADARKEVIASYTGGQSNAQGGHGLNSDPITFAAGTAYATEADDTDLGLREMTVNASGTGPDRHGSNSPVYGFAAEMWDTYGIRAVSAMGAWQGTAVLENTPNGIAPAFRWAHSTDSLSLLKSSQILGPQVRNRIIPHLFECLRLRPDLKAIKKVFQWSQGEAEAPHLLSGTVTKAEYQAGLQTVWDTVKAAGFDLMVIHEHGRKGLDSAEIAANEPMNVLVREAQADFVAANADVIWGSQAAKSTGPLVVDAGGRWVSGFDYHTDDGGVHWKGDSANAMGRSAAKKVYEHYNPPAEVDTYATNINGVSIDSLSIVGEVATFTVTGSAPYAGSYDVDASNLATGAPILLRNDSVVGTGTVRTVTPSMWVSNSLAPMMFAREALSDGAALIGALVGNTLTIPPANADNQIDLRTTAQNINGTTIAPTVLVQEAAPYVAYRVNNQGTANLVRNGTNLATDIGAPTGVLTFSCLYNFKTRPAGYGKAIASFGGVRLVWYQNTNQLEIRIFDTAGATVGRYQTNAALPVGASVADQRIHGIVDINAVTPTLAVNINGAAPAMTAQTVLTRGTGLIQTTNGVTVCASDNTFHQTEFFLQFGAAISDAAITSNVLTAGAPQYLMSGNTRAAQYNLGEHEGTGGNFGTVTANWVDV